MSNKPRHGLGIRGDSLYCPLSLHFDPYLDCVTDVPAPGKATSCIHCFFRRLNKTWKWGLSPADPETLRKKLENGLQSKNPRSSLAHALKNQNTIRFGNRSDPFQPAELARKASLHAMEILADLEWSYVIQTRYTEVLIRPEYRRLLERSKGRVTVLPYISPGLDKDWAWFELRKTTQPVERMRHLAHLRDKYGISVAVNGEPFIPGVHTIEDYKRTLELLLQHGINQYSTYSFHMNEYVAQNLHDAGFDIEKIWKGNQDGEWKHTLSEIIQVSKEFGVHLGCPDFVNSGDYVEETNTCCGINVPHPTTFNTITWKRELIRNPELDPEALLARTWDGVGNWEQGRGAMFGNLPDMYTMKDAGFDFGRGLEIIK